MSKKTIIVDELPIDIQNGAVYEIDQSTPNRFTHNFFKYPCKFIPELPLWAMKKYIHKKDSMILDPFNGSGTTSLEAVINGFASYGVEIDEVAKLISKVKCYSFNSTEIDNIKKTYLFIKNTYNTSNIYRPDIKNIEHWFPEDAIDDLGKLISTINKIEDERIRNYFKVIFVSIIKPCSYCDNASPKPYVSTKIKKEPKNVFEEFSSNFDRYIKETSELSTLSQLGSFTILKGDALSFQFDGEFDLAFTSPPYINAFDYVRTMRLENLWLGFHDESSLLKSKANYVGTEKINQKQLKIDSDIFTLSQILFDNYINIQKMDKKRADVVAKYFSDMFANLKTIKKHLKIGSIYGIVVGDNEICKEVVKTSEILTDLATSIGFELDCYYSYLIKNPYIRIPRNGKGGQVKYDNVICLRRVK